MKSWAGREEARASPGDAPLANTAGVQVAALGLLRGPTVPGRFVAEAPAEAWGTCATLTHPSTAWTIVTQTVDTAAICREGRGAGK